MATIGELVEELRHNLLRDRSDQVPGADSDQLWDDKSLCRYINTAQDKFASLTSCLRDSRTPEVCQLPIIAGQNSFTLHEKVIAVMSARYPGDNADLARAGHEAFDSYISIDRRWFDPQYLSTLQPGKPLAWGTDEGMAQSDDGSYSSMEFRVYPVVGVGFDATLALRVIRLPLEHLTMDNPRGRPEIPAQYHMDLLDWAGYLALRGPDLDVAGGEAFSRAMALRGSFMSTIEECKRDLKRRMFAPMQWNFGRGAWSTWERD